MKIFNCTMMKNATLDHLNADKNSLQVKHHQNLLKNYAAMKTTSNYVKCTTDHDYKCQILNTSEYSAAFNNYLEKMFSATIANDEKLLQICQEIDKLHNTIQVEKNDGITASNCTKESNIDFEQNILQNKEITSLFRTETLTELPSNSRKDNDNLTTDDFLTMHDEIIIPIDEQEIEMTQNNSSLLQSPPTENLPCSEKSEKEVQKMNNMLNKSDQTVGNSQSPTDRPYVCLECQMAFKRNLHLKRHFLVTHTLNKNFKCDTCGKLFSRKDYLDKHITGHQKKDLKIKLLEQGIVVRTKIFSKSNK